MAVRSGPMGRSTGSKVIPRHSVETIAVVILWIVAILLWLASTFGNFVQFVGGWGYVWPLSERTASGLLFALIYQAVCTLAQWGFKAKRWWALYILVLLASAAPSFLTYNEWANGWVAGFLGSSVPVSLAWWLASLPILLVTLFVDLIPEWVLVE